MVLRNDLAVIRAGQRLDATLEHADQNRQNPEFKCGAQEERGEEDDAHVRHHGGGNHGFRAEPACQLAVDDGAGERHELRDEQRHDQLRGVDAQLRAIRRAHGNDGVDGVDVEEERDHEHPQRLVLADGAERGAELGERAANGLACLPRGGAVMHLLIAGEQRNGERHPPQRGDDERGARAGCGRPAEQRGASENQRDADDERHGRTDIAPCVAV